VLDLNKKTEDVLLRMEHELAGEEINIGMRENPVIRFSQDIAPEYG